MINIIRDLLLSFHLMLLLGELLFCVGVKRRKFFALRIIPSATLYLSFPFLLPNRWYNGFFMIGSWFSWLFLFIFCHVFADYILLF